MPNFKKLWQQGERAYNNDNYRRAADMYLKAFNSAPDPWADGRYHALCMFMELFYAGVMKEADWAALVDIAMDENEKYFFRYEAAYSLGHMLREAGSLDHAGFVLRKALRLIKRVGPDERCHTIRFWLDSTPGEHNVGKRATDREEVLKAELSMLEYGEMMLWKDDSPVFSDLDRDSLGVGGFKCDGCKKSLKALKRKNLEACGRCRKSYYCCSECQITAWEDGHREHCRKPGDIRQGDFMLLVGLIVESDFSCCIVRVVSQKGDEWTVRKHNDDGEMISVKPERLAHLRPLK